MVAGPDPFIALLQSIEDAQAASGAGAASPFAPGAQGITAQGVQAGDAMGGPPGAAAASIGAGGGSVPGTATTGEGLARGIVEGAINPGGATATSLFDRVERSGEGPERPSVPGGDIGTLLAVLGGPTAALSIIPSLVASDALGMAPDPSLLSTTSLAELAMGGGGDSTPGFSGSGAINADGTITPAISSPLAPGAGTFSPIRAGGIPERDRPERPERTADQRSSGGFSGSRSTAR